jgi:hypothetical protein
MDGHHEDHITKGGDFLYRFDGRFGIEAYTGGGTHFVKFIDKALGFFGDFNVKRYVVGAGFDKRLSIPGRLTYHQVRIENKIAVPAKLCNDGRANGYIGNEVTIHYIQMHHIYACGLDDSDFIGQPGEIGTQD